MGEEGKALDGKKFFSTLILLIAQTVGRRTPVVRVLGTSPDFSYFFYFFEYQNYGSWLG